MLKIKCKQLRSHGFRSRGAFKLCKYIEIYDRLLSLLVYQHLGNIADISAEILIGFVRRVPSRRLRFVYTLIHNNKGRDFRSIPGDLDDQISYTQGNFEHFSQDFFENQQILG